MAWTRAHGGHWVVTGYDEVSAAFRDWENLSSTRINNPDTSAMSIVPIKMRRTVPDEMDPPEWHTYRQAIGILLAPRATERLGPRIEH